jgi:hypothetical protein
LGKGWFSTPIFKDFNFGWFSCKSGVVVMMNKVENLVIVLSFCGGKKQLPTVTCG